MKKFFVLSIVLITQIIYSQDIKIHLFKNTYLKDSFTELSKTVKIKELSLIYDNFSENGSRDEYEKFYTTFETDLDYLSIIPGHNEIYKANSGLTLFKDYWNSYNVEKMLSDSTIFYAFSSYPLIKGQKPFVKEETISWLKKSLSQAKNIKLIIVVTNNDILEFSNTEVLFDLFKDYKTFIISPGKQWFKKGNKKFLIPLSTKLNHNLFTIKNDSLFINNNLINSEKFKPFSSTQIKVTKKARLDTLYSSGQTITTTPLICDSLLYFTTFDGSINCIDYKGELKWSFLTNSYISSRPAISGDILLAGTNNGDLLALNKFNGELLQSIGFDDAITTNLMVMNYNGNKELISEKRTNSKASVLLGLANGSFYCYDIETFEEYWNNSKLKVKLEGNFFNIKNRIYFSSGNSLFCADSRNGLLIWKWKPSKKFNGKLSVLNITFDKEKIFVNDDSGNLYAIDIRLGKSIWKNDNSNICTFVLTKDKKRIIAKSSKDKVYILKSSNGRKVKQININYGNDNLCSGIIQNNDDIFFANNEGTLYRINKKNYYRTLLKNFNAISYLSVFHNKSLMITNDGLFILFEELE